MSSQEENVKKKLAEDKRLNDEVELAKETELKARLLKEALLNQKQEHSDLSFSPVIIDNDDTKKDDWEKIKADFIEKYPNTPIEDNRLAFNTKEEAITFFTNQAESKREFLCNEVDSSGKSTGFNVFSCGNGRLYQGTLQEIKEQLQVAKKENPNDLKVRDGLAKIDTLLNPTNQFKKIVQEQKESEKENEGTYSQNIALNPLGTNLKSK